LLSVSRRLPASPFQLPASPFQLPSDKILVGDGDINREGFDLDLYDVMPFFLKR
jgi:hypothetical protein